MGRRKAVIYIAVFFLVQSGFTDVAISSELNHLNPPANTESGNPVSVFKRLYFILDTAIGLYKLDAIQGWGKDSIIESARGSSAGYRNISFDLSRIDTRKKGCTRYYPFSVGQKSFIIRIFLTEERAFQPGIEVFYEGQINNPPVTFQIIPDVVSILKSQPIKPLDFDFAHLEASRSP